MLHQLPCSWHHRVSCYISCNGWPMDSHPTRWKNSSGVFVAAKLFMHIRNVTPMRAWVMLEFQNVQNVLVVEAFLQSEQRSFWQKALELFNAMPKMKVLDDRLYPSQRVLFIQSMAISPHTHPNSIHSCLTIYYIYK